MELRSKPAPENLVFVGVGAKIRMTPGQANCAFGEVKTAAVTM